MLEHIIIAGLVVVYMLIAGLNRNIVSPVLPILHRWVRWVLFSFVAAYGIYVSEWVHKPFWLLVCTAFSLWFVIETAYQWVVINIVNTSAMPLFPTFRASAKQYVWPTNAHFLEIKDQIRTQGFQPTECLESVMAPGLVLKSSFFENQDKTTRLQVLFFPSRNHQLLLFFVFTIKGVEGELFVTDNITIPYGGVYPDSWHIMRRPLVGHFLKLSALHQQQCAAYTLKPWDISALEHIRSQQAALNAFNLQCGIMNDLQSQKSLGRMTSEGCYRVWKELWLLRYFGRSLHG